MTLEKLNHYAAKALKASFEEAVQPGAQLITGMPHTPGYRDKLGSLIPEIMDLSERIEALDRRIMQQETEVSGFVNAIPDVYIWAVFRLRFLKGMTWEKVADTVGGKNTAAGVKQTVYRYLNSLHMPDEKVVPL